MDSGDLPGDVWEDVYVCCFCKASFDPPEWFERDDYTLDTPECPQCGYDHYFPFRYNDSRYRRDADYRREIDGMIDGRDC